MEVCDPNESDGNNQVVCTTLDIVKYSSRYNGYTKIQRLLLIAEKCSNNKLQALRQLLSDLKCGSNYSLYSTISDKIGSDSSVDGGWVEATKRTFNAKLEALESDLTKAKSAIGKESMRAKYCDLASLHYERGNLNEALKYLMRAKEYCSLPKQLTDVWLDIVVTSIDLNSFPQAVSYIEKAESCLQGSPDKLTQAKIQLASGLVQLRLGHFKDVPGLLSEVDPCVRGHSGALASAEDVATYATITAVAVLTRREVRRLLDHSNFRQFFEHCMHVRVFAQDYLSGNFDACFKFLNDYKAQFLLDIHLSSSIEELHRLITDQIVLQYLTPYSVVDLVKMSRRLNLNQVELEKLISALVSSRKLSGKIDSLENSFHRMDAYDDQSTIETLLRVAAKSEHDVKRSILRLSLVQHNFSVTEADARNRAVIQPVADAPPSLAEAADDVEEGLDEEMTE